MSGDFLKPSLFLLAEGKSEFLSRPRRVWVGALDEPRDSDRGCLCTDVARRLSNGVQLTSDRHKGYFDKLVQARADVRVWSG